MSYNDQEIDTVIENAVDELSNLDNKIDNANEKVNDAISKSFIDTNKIVLNPTKNLYQIFEDNFSGSFDKFYNEKIEAKTKISDVSNNLQRQIIEKRNEIDANYRENKIGARKFANIMIILFSIILIGLCFIGYFKKNKIAIRKFNEFKTIKTNEINVLIEQKELALQTAFSKYNINQIKDMLLEAFSIQKVKNIKRNEIRFLQTFTNFLNYNSVTKYDIRNSYVYDILYSRKYYKPIITSNTIWVTETDSDGNSHSHSITATHTEPTPFIDYKTIYTIPTNYTPTLSFLNRGSISKKELVKKRKLGKEFVCENDDFATNFNYWFDDELKFVQYFEITTQQKFVDFYNYFRTKNITNFSLNKFKANIYSDLSSNYLSTYKTNATWIYNKILSNKNIVANDVVRDIKSEIYFSVQRLFQFLTMAYSNKDICIESFEDLGKMYTFDYQDDNKFSTQITDTYFYLLNAFNATNTFSFRYTEFDSLKPAYFIPQNFEKYDDFIKQTIEMCGWYSRNEIDSVWEEGYIIDVPYVRYYDTSEFKSAIFSSKHYLKNANAIILSSFNNNFFTQLDDETLNQLIIKNKIQTNQNAIENKKEFAKYVNLIDKLYENFPLLKGNASICINHQLFAILIDDTRPLIQNDHYKFQNVVDWINSNI